MRPNKGDNIIDLQAYKDWILDLERNPWLAEMLAYLGDEVQTRIVLKKGPKDSMEEE